MAFAWIVNYGDLQSLSSWGVGVPGPNDAIEFNIGQWGIPTVASPSGSITVGSAFFFGVVDLYGSITTTGISYPVLPNVLVSEDPAEGDYGDLTIEAGGSLIGPGSILETNGAVNVFGLLSGFEIELTNNTYYSLADDSPSLMVGAGGEITNSYIANDFDSSFSINDGLIDECSIAANVTNNGIIANSSIFSTVINNGIIETTIGGGIYGTVDGSGSIIIRPNSTLGLYGGQINGNQIAFDTNGSNETFVISGTKMPSSIISGFLSGDTIDLQGVPFDTGGSALLQSFGGGSSSNVLTITENGSTYFLQLDPTQSFLGDQFILSADPYGLGTDIVVKPGLDVNLTFDQSQSTLPLSFIQGADTAAYYYETHFTNVATLNINIGLGELNGDASALIGKNAQTHFFYSPVSYATASTALTNIPVSPFPFASYLEMTLSEQKALGIISPNSATLDASIGLNASLSGNGLVSVAEHEISEVMGRLSFLGMPAAFGLIGEYGVLDLYRYSAPNVPDTTVSPPAPYTQAYFSTDNGNKQLAYFNTGAGDLGDWASNQPNDAFLAVDGNPSTASFTAVDTEVMNVLGWNSIGGNVACYVRGTKILTNRGEVMVEDLSIAELVTTASGEERPIKWIGRRSYSGRFIMGRRDILPICIKASALSDGCPRRELWVSPHHAMYLDGVLIEAKDLINGVSIVQAEEVEKVEYFHVELDSHDVIIAEGAGSETFVNDDDRAMFHNAHEYDLLYPQGNPLPVRYCAPRLDAGYEVEVVRRRINARAGLRTVTDDYVPSLRGYVDEARNDRISGWAQTPEYPEAAVCLDIWVAGRKIGQVLANRYRRDLECAGIGSGRHGFEFKPVDGLNVATGPIEVRRSLDGMQLPNALANGLCSFPS